ncbi:hypothetical protein [Photobacterium leiognathi]|uniref:hypothetical protein n=1 Tax=Photobacterium leiognathi TaxID=553611 RepID=UPI002981B3BB|nr:hypothetical protein [Photobacterium leiognathi]
MDLDLFDRLVMSAHGEQRYGSRPYRFHLEFVRDIIYALPSLDEEGVFKGVSFLDLTCVALGHDLIEDTDVTMAEIAALTNMDVAEAISLISDQKAGSRKDKKRHTLSRFKNYPNKYVKKLAATVKYADRLCNLHFSLRGLDGTDMRSKKLIMYIEEHDAFAQTYKDYCSSAVLVRAVDSIIELSRNALRESG